MKKWGALVVALLVAAIVAGSASASGRPANTYLCYSKYQVDPGVWSQVAPVPQHANVSSVQLLGMGYWLPVAEKSVPTHTLLPGGWYLNCNYVPKTVAGVPPTNQSWVGNDGNMLQDQNLVTSDYGLSEGYYLTAQ